MFCPHIYVLKYNYELTLTSMFLTKDRNQNGKRRIRRRKKRRVLLNLVLFQQHTIIIIIIIILGEKNKQKLKMNIRPCFCCAIKSLIKIYMTFATLFLIIQCQGKQSPNLSIVELDILTSLLLELMLVEKD